MKYFAILAAAALFAATGCEKKAPETAEEPTEDPTAAKAEEEAEQAEVAREEEHGRPMDFQVTSEAFEDGESIPDQYTCAGEGISPPLTWSKPPEGTQSFALVMTDPDAPKGTFHHWGVYAIPHGEQVLPAKVPNEPKLAMGAFQATNDAKDVGYAAPCPPKGDEAHRYVFRIFALDEPGTTYPQPPTVEALIDELTAEAIGEAKLVGTFKRAN